MSHPFEYDRISDRTGKGGHPNGNDDDAEDLAAHAGLESVTAGQLIEAKLDVVMANDITGPMAVPVFIRWQIKCLTKIR